MINSEMQTLKSLLLKNIDDNWAREAYNLLMHDNGIFHQGTTIEKKQALIVYSNRVAMMSRENNLFERLNNLVDKISKSSENQIIISNLIFNNFAFSIFFTNENTWFEIIKIDSLNYSKMESLIHDYKNKQLDVSSYFRIKNGNILDGF